MVNDFSGVGDSRTVNTKAIQDAVDYCSDRGGGIVIFLPGVYKSGTIYLKSNVTLQIDNGVQLIGSENIDDYPDQVSELPTYDKPDLTSKALIYAEGQENIAITGYGIINGNGDLIDRNSGRKGYLAPSFKYRPRIIHIRDCDRVLIDGVKLTNSGSWVQTYQQCTNLVINGIYVDSKENPDIEKPIREYEVLHRNTDGLDIVDCRFVSVSNSHISSGDDAICIKSFSPDQQCSNITISNCHFSSNATGIKIGTETAGNIQDIIIDNCTVYDCRGEGIGIMSVDGASIRRVSLTNITLQNIKRSAIFIRLHTRNRSYGRHARVNKNPTIDGVVLENIQGSRLSSVGCSITALDDFQIKNVVFNNVNLSFDGAEAESNQEIPEIVDGYPVGNMFGPTLPAYGFYIKNVQGLTMSSLKLRTEKADTRPAIIAGSSSDLRIDELYVGNPSLADEIIRFNDIKNSIISDAKISMEIPVFVSIKGEASRGITLRNNTISSKTIACQLESSLDRHDVITKD